MLHELVEILVDNRKRRVANNDVGLLQKFDALLAPEVAVTFELIDVSVFIFTIIYKLYPTTVFPIACSDKLLKA